VNWQGERRKCSLLAGKGRGEEGSPKQQKKKQILNFVTGVSAITQPSPPV